MSTRVEIAEYVREGLRPLGRGGRQRPAHVARLDLREHRIVADALEVGGDPLERRLAVPTERVHGTVPRRARERQALELPPAVGLELLEQRDRVERAWNRQQGLDPRPSGLDGGILVPTAELRERCVGNRLVEGAPVRRRLRKPGRDVADQRRELVAWIRSRIDDLTGEHFEPIQHERQRPAHAEEAS